MDTISKTAISTLFYYLLIFPIAMVAYVQEAPLYPVKSVFHLISELLSELAKIKRVVTLEPILKNASEIA